MKIFMDFFWRSCYASDMPVHPTKGGGYQWGGHGKVYTGKGAKRRALIQAAAAHANGYGEKKLKGRRRVLG